MEYLSAREAAARWGVSLRYVQRLLQQGRIEGARKFDRSWLIPATAERPGDNRRKATGESDTPVLLPCGFLSFSVPLPAHDLRPDDHALASALAAAGFPPDASHVRQLAAELAYARGDFAPARENFAAAKDEPMALSAALLAACAAVSQGDYGFYQEVRAFFERMRKRHPQSAAAIDSSYALVYASMFVPQSARAWIERVSADLPEQNRWYEVYLLAKCYQVVEDYAALYACARTALALQPRDAQFRYPVIYLELMAAAASYGLDDMETCRHYLERAAEKALPRGFYTPFAETFLCFGGEFERVCDERWAQDYKVVKGRWRTTWTNWVAFHNRFAQDQVATTLSKRENLVAHCLARGLTYTQTAQKTGMSFSCVKNLASSVYDKLGVAGKKELALLTLS